MSSFDSFPPPSAYDPQPQDDEYDDQQMDDDDAPLSSTGRRPRRPFSLPNADGQPVKIPAGRGGSFQCCHTCEGPGHGPLYSWKSQKPKLLHEVSSRSHKNCAPDCPGFPLLSTTVPCLHTCSSCPSKPLSHYALLHAAQKAKHPLCHEECPGWPYHAGLIKNLNVVKIEKKVKEKKVKQPRGKGQKRKKSNNESGSEGESNGESGESDSDGESDSESSGSSDDYRGGKSKKRKAKGKAKAKSKGRGKTGKDSKPRANFRGSKLDYSFDLTNREALLERLKFPVFFCQHSCSCDKQGWPMTAKGWKIHIRNARMHPECGPHKDCGWLINCTPEQEREARSLSNEFLKKVKENAGIKDGEIKRSRWKKPSKKARMEALAELADSSQSEDFSEEEKEGKEQEGRNDELYYLSSEESELSLYEFDSASSLTDEERDPNELPGVPAPQPPVPTTGEDRVKATSDSLLASVAALSYSSKVKSSDESKRPHHLPMQFGLERVKFSHHREYLPRMRENGAKAPADFAEPLIALDFHPNNPAADPTDSRHRLVRCRHSHCLSEMRLAHRRKHEKSRLFHPECKPEMKCHCLLKRLRRRQEEEEEGEGEGEEMEQDGEGDGEGEGEGDGEANADGEEDGDGNEENGDNQDGDGDAGDDGNEEEEEEEDNENEEEAEAEEGEE